MALAQIVTEMSCWHEKQEEQKNRQTNGLKSLCPSKFFEAEGIQIRFDISCESMA